MKSEKPPITAKRLYGLKLHHAIAGGLTDLILRVPGGWVYASSAGTATFVPYSDEFKPKRKR